MLSKFSERLEKLIGIWSKIYASAYPDKFNLSYREYCLGVLCR